jgi:hypothetical protein
MGRYVQVIGLDLENLPKQMFKINFFGLHQIFKATHAMRWLPHAAPWTDQTDEHRSLLHLGIKDL